MALDYAACRKLLEDVLAEAESRFAGGEDLSAPSYSQQYDLVFLSKTQAFREVLLGCVVARLADASIDITLPYANQGPRAFNGRTLDERVINPFLTGHKIPCSRGPYLAVFRRSVRFDARVREGLRDKEDYDALLTLLETVRKANARVVQEILNYVLYRFLKLREASQIALHLVGRISLEQYRTLIGTLLSRPSGGRFPVFIVVSAFEAIKKFYRLSWIVEYQGINVADAPSGAGADIVIRDGDSIVLAVEVTERPIEKNWVVSTFNTKIAPQRIENYIFLLHGTGASMDSIEQARRYFAQGHEIDFLQITDWVYYTLATITQNGRKAFEDKMIELLNDPSTPNHVKLAWNEAFDALLTR